MSKPREALDVDDVQTKQVKLFLSWNNIREWARQKQLTYKDYSENWPEMWQTTLEETRQRRQGFFTPEIFRQMEVVEDAALWIPKIAAIRGLYAVTARPDILKEVTEETLEGIAPGAYDGVICTGKIDEDGNVTRMSKADVCLELDANGLTDDQVKACLEVQAVGKRPIVFGNYDWNKHAPSDIQRASDLGHLYGIFTAEDESRQLVS